MPIKEWLLSWNLQSDMIWIQLYEFCGTITCGMELKSYFSGISGALVSIRTMFLQHLISMRAVCMLNQDDFTENRVSNPAHPTCRTLLAAGALWSYITWRSPVCSYLTRKAVWETQTMGPNAGIGSESAVAQRNEVRPAGSTGPSQLWAERAGTEKEDSSWNMPCRKLFIVNQVVGILWNSPAFWYRNSRVCVMYKRLTN